VSVLLRRSLLLLLFVAPATRAADSSPNADFKPDPASVRRFGPAYRYPQDGWIVLHVEGAPYERGYQHGVLMAKEIAGYVEALAKGRSTADPASA